MTPKLIILSTVTSTDVVLQFFKKIITKKKGG